MIASGTVVAVVGATGTGKSALALGLAAALHGRGQPAEVVNADAMQLYRGMDIGTAKVPEAERRGIPHHLLDVLDPTEEASVAAYQRDARAAIDGIAGRGAVPILVGGSGLYVSAVLHDFRFPGTDPEVRARLETELSQHGPGALYERLRIADPEAADAIGPHNGRRIVRALEVVELTGEPFGSGLDAEQSWWRPAIEIGLRTDTPLLAERLNARVEAMWRDGILDEAEALRERGIGVTASHAIGYAQALAQLDGILGERQAIEQTQALTRRYARRQRSWFGRSTATQWLDAEAPDVAEQALARLDA